MTISHDETLAPSVPRSKAEAAFVALAAGDALGWPQEARARSRSKRAQASVSFRTWQRRAGGRFYPYSEVIEAGEYSDDTQLTLAIARCLISGGPAWWTLFTRNELPMWTLYERGGGGATKRAAESWLRGVPPWKHSDMDAVRKYFEAGGNGVAMRVVPHALHCAGDPDPTNLLRNVATDGAATHGHPRALVGAVAYAFAVWWLLRARHTIAFGELVRVLLDHQSVWGSLPTGSPTRNGWIDAANRTVGSYERSWHEVVEEMARLLVAVGEGLAAGSLAEDEEVLSSLGAFGTANGAGTVTAAAAIYLACRYAAQPSNGILRAAFAIGADTDTLAAMVGGLLGALAGSDWLPAEWSAVQDANYLRQVANKLVTRPAQADLLAPRHVTARDLENVVAALVAGKVEHVDFGGTRQVRLADPCPIESASRSTTVREWRLSLTDGQTVYVTKLARKAVRDVAAEPASNDGPRQQSLPDLRTQPSQARAAGVKLTVSSISVSTAFYEQLLGLVSVRRTPNFVSFGALSLVDGHYAADLSEGLVRPDMTTGRNRVEIAVGNLEDVRARLTAHNVSIVRPISVLPWGERSLHCVDPDGNLVEIVERK